MKDWYKSRTLWFNVISILLVIVAELAQLPDLATYAPYFAAAVTIGNVVLRTLTSEPLRLPGQDRVGETEKARFLRMRAEADQQRARIESELADSRTRMHRRLDQ